MNVRKYSMLGVTVVLLAIFLIVGVKTLIHFYNENSNFKETLSSFTEIVEQEKLNDITLTIYYVNPRDLLRRPLDESSIREMHQLKVTVSGEELVQHKSLLYPMIHSDLQLVNKKSNHPFTRLFYVFENENGDIIFRVSMSVDRYTMYVNGYEVKGNIAFYEVVMPFLPEYAVQELSLYLSRVKNEGKKIQSAR